MRLLGALLIAAIFPIGMASAHAKTLLAGGAMSIVSQSGVMCEMPPSCPDLTKIVDLCSAVSTAEVLDDPLYYYSYQKQIYEAACVDIVNDGINVRVQKVQALWQALEAESRARSTARNIVDRRHCNANSFNIVGGGNVLKLAVKTRFTKFIVDAVHLWGIDANKIDHTDGRTVLDYIDSELAAARRLTNGAELVDALERYRTIVSHIRGKTAAQVRAEEAAEDRN